MTNLLSEMYNNGISFLNESTQDKVNKLLNSLKRAKVKVSSRVSGTEDELYLDLLFLQVPALINSKFTVVFSTKEDQIRLQINLGKAGSQVREYVNDFLSFDPKFKSSVLSKFSKKSMGGSLKSFTTKGQKPGDLKLVNDLLVKIGQFKKDSKG